VGSGPLRAAPGVARGVPRSRTTTEVRVSTGVVGSGSTMAVLPLPYAPEALTVPGSWLEDDTTLMVYSTGQQLSGLSYAVAGAQFHPDRRVLGLPAQYPLSIKGSYLGFPSGPRRELAKLAARITRGDRTPIARARALQSYFTNPSNGFTYKLGVTLKPGMAGLTQFLFHSKQGFCQQFAIAMAALARQVGIPSRIAVGYTAGTEQADGTWKVTTANAHAWPELYFRDVGWLRFEPTPGGAAGTASAPAYSYAGPPGARVLPGTRTAPGGAAGVRPRSAASNPAFAHIRRPAPGAGGASQTRGQSIVAVIFLAVAVILGLALVTPLTARWLIRRRRLALLGRGTRAGGPDAQALDARLAHAAWGEFRDSLADYGLACRGNESPRALAARVASTMRLDPTTRGALYRIASAEERARYASVPLTSGTLRADTAAVRRALAREAHWLVRWRAWLLPASTLTPIRRGLQHSLDVVGSARLLVQPSGQAWCWRAACRQGRGPHAGAPGVDADQRGAGVPDLLRSVAGDGGRPAQAGRHPRGDGGQRGVHRAGVLRADRPGVRAGRGDQPGARQGAEGTQDRRQRLPAADGAGGAGRSWRTWRWAGCAPRASSRTCRRR
jgi:transglutaminase-like putative cysteine protease